MTDRRRTRTPGPSRAAAPIDAGQASLMVLGDRANLLIVREAFRYTRRYQDFKERLGMSDAVLASRLRDLVEIGVFRTVQYSDRPPRSEYRLTECGIDFWQTAIGIWMWEHRWGHRAYGRIPQLVHLTCGEDTTAHFGCGGCSTVGVTASDVDVEAGRIINDVVRAPVRRYRRASWKPAPRIDLYSEIDPLMGDRWTVCTLVASMVGIDRFAGLQRALEISPPLLSKRLAELVQRDVLERIMVADGGHHHRYRLRPKGLDLMPILIANFAWANRWFPPMEGPMVTVTHKPCRRELVPAWFCAGCGEQMDRSTMTFDIYPASTPLRS